MSKKTDIIFNVSDLKDYPLTITDEQGESAFIRFDPCPVKWECSGVTGNPFRAAFAINLFLWSLGIFEEWGE